MIISCPWCGNRDAGEFTYRGDGTIKRPSMDESDVEAYNAYVYDRKNPAGSHQELWHHSGGCRSHLMVTRNTLTHEIYACELVGPWAASVKGAGQ